MKSNETMSYTKGENMKVKNCFIFKLGYTFFLNVQFLKLDNLFTLNEYIKCTCKYVNIENSRIITSLLYNWLELLNFNHIRIIC